MKQFKINTILTGALIMMGVFSFSSCLKNGTYYTDFSAVSASVDLPLAAANVNGPVPFAYSANVTNPQIGVYVNLASPSTLSKPVTVTLAIDSAYLSSYNQANGTSYTLMPANCYTVNSLNLTIAPGQRLDSANVKFNFANFDFTKSYILPFTIASASEPIEQWNHLMLSILVKNKYDGNYSLDIETTGWSAYGISDGLPGTYPGTMGLVTAGVSSVTFSGTGGSGNLEPAFTTGNASATAFGATTPEFTFDPTTNLLTSVINTTPNDGRNRQLAINPAVTDSRWDPNTGTIYAAYIMTQTGRPPQYIYDTLTYIGPR
jgi:hypothetical protein